MREQKWRKWSKVCACSCLPDLVSTWSIVTEWESREIPQPDGPQVRFSAEMSIPDVKNDREGDLSLATAGL